MIEKNIIIKILFLPYLIAKKWIWRDTDILGYPLTDWEAGGIDNIYIIHCHIVDNLRNK